MKNALYFKNKEMQPFAPDLFIRLLGKTSDEERDVIQKAIITFSEKYTYDINFSILDEEDAGNLFFNIQYFMSYYVYENDVNVRDEMSDVYSFINKSYEYYKDVLSQLKERINKLYDNNPLKSLPEVIIYLERLKLTIAKYENLIDCNLDKQIIEFMPLDFKGADYPFFSLISEVNVGFYSFFEIISEIEMQFEFFKLFKEEDVVRVYQGLNYDVSPSGEEYKYTDVLTPVLQQYLFCSEYSFEPAKLILTENDVKNIGVDMKIFFTKIEREEKYYLLSSDDFKCAVNLINSSYISEYYKSKLENLIKDFRCNEKISPEGNKVCLASVLDRLISNIKNSKGFENNQKVSLELIDILTKNDTSVLYNEDYIDDEYKDILITSLKEGKAFKSLKEETQQYILRNVPDVRKSLLAFKKMKNLAFLL